MFDQNHEGSLIFGFTMLKLFNHILFYYNYGLCHCFRMVNLCESVMHHPHFTWTDFWIPAGKGALLCLIHHLAHYFAYGLISTSVLTTFSCLSSPRCHQREGFVAMTPTNTSQSVRLLIGDMWKILEFLYIPGWHLTLDNMKWDQVSSHCLNVFMWM